MIGLALKLVQSKISMHPLNIKGNSFRLKGLQEL